MVLIALHWFRYNPTQGGHYSEFHMAVLRQQILYGGLRAAFDQNAGSFGEHEVMAKDKNKVKPLKNWIEIITKEEHIFNIYS